MFIKLTTASNYPLLLDPERFISVLEDQGDRLTRIGYSNPGESVTTWNVKDTVEEILEKIADIEEGLYE